MNLRNVFTFFVLNCVTFNFVFSEQITNDEALFVRRILEFWRDKESKIVKLQIEQFIESYPNSSYVDSLLVILGDTHWKENNLKEALLAYDSVKADFFKKKVFNNRLDCLYRLEKYEELIQEIDSTEPFFEESHLTPEQALWTYFKAESWLQMAKQGHRELYEKAIPLYKKIAQSEHKENANLALAEIELSLGHPENASKYYLQLAEDLPEKRNEMLLQVAQLQAVYDPHAALLTLEKIDSSQAIINKMIILFDLNDHERIINERENLVSQLDSAQKSILDFFNGRSHFALKQYEKAIFYLKPLINAQIQLPNPEVIDKTVMLTLAACAHHLGDLPLITQLAIQFETKYPNDSSYAKFLYLKALTHHNLNQYQEALNNYTSILREFPSFDQKEKIQFEIGLLHYKKGEHEKSLSSFQKLIEETPDSTESLGALQYIPCITLHELEKAEEKGEACDHLREQLLNDLKKALDASVAKPAQKPLYLLKMGKTYYDLQKYQEALDILNQCVEQNCDEDYLFQAHLLLAMSYREGFQNSDKFVHHAEKTLEIKPEFSDQCRLRLNLFSTYLQLAEEGNEFTNTEKAIEHLYKVFVRKKEQIKLENQLWMADHFYNKIKSQTNEYLVEVLTSQEAVEIAKKALKVYQNVLYAHHNNEPTSITEETIYLEHEFFKLSNLYGWLEKIDQQIDILNHIIASQQNYPDWKWRLKTRTIFAKANALKTKGNGEEALAYYANLINQLKPSDHFILNASKLNWCRLALEKLPRHKMSLEDPETMSILKILKDLQIRKSFAHEPLHLEAALEYASLRSLVEPENNQEEQKLFSLRRIKEDFTKKEDLWSKDYHASRLLHPSKEVVYQAYMMLVDAHLAAIEAKIALKKKDMLEKQAKLDAAQAIYQNLLKGPYAVTQYLVDQATHGLEITNDLE